MNTQRAKDQINNKKPDYLQKARRTGYVCPSCGNGTGKNGDGIIVDPRSTGHPHYKCYKCGLYADNLELISKRFDLKDFKQTLNKGCELYGITIKEKIIPLKEKEDTQNASKSRAKAEQKPVNEEDFKEEFKAWANAMQVEGNPGQLYLQGRGLSLETISRFNIGYCETWKHPKTRGNDNIPSSPRVIIPTSDYSYLARDIREEIPENEKRYSKSKAGQMRIFNSEGIKDNKNPCFLVEGEIDALSIIEAGGQAIALGSTANINTFLDRVSECKGEAPFIIALDNDSAGNSAREQLIKGLKEKSIEYYTLNPCGTHKDPNEALQKDREQFIKTVKEITEDPAKWDYNQNNVSAYIPAFLDGIDASVNTPVIPTAFNNLDEALDGGLYEGLYIIGAISTLGKTTFVQQIADQIAQAGKDVLYISLEMARTELMAKSISRHTLLNALQGNGKKEHSKTARGITTGAKWINYSSEEKKLIHASIKDYSQYAPHLYIFEGIGNIGVMEIAEVTQRHINITGNKPVIVIDYLQILQPYDPRTTEKQNTDKAVLELKRLSRKHKIPVIAVSSFNRENYRSVVNMQSFKESGAIEYGSDVLIGLQLKGAGDSLKEEGKIDIALSNDPREIELKILKNRNGKRLQGALNYNYHPMFNYFEEAKDSAPKKTLRI